MAPRAIGPSCPMCGKAVARPRVEQEMELKLARRLGLTPPEVRSLGLSVYGRHLVEERAARSEGDSRRGALGHITRDLGRELAELLQQRGAA